MIISLQYLRGIAALMVVYHHISFQLLKAGSPLILPFAGTGAAGVDIFFVISGFIMWITTRSQNITTGQFIYRRLIRVVPLYWAVTIMLLALAYFMPALLETTKFDLEHATLSMLFIPMAHPQLDGEVLPFFIQGWTLNYEMFFYGIFALAMAISTSAMFGIIAAVLFAFVLAGFIVTPENAVLKFYSSTLLLEFIAGMALGWFYLRWPAIPRRIAWWLIAISLLLLFLSAKFGYFYGPNGFAPERAFIWGAAGLALVAGAVYLTGSLRGTGSGPLWWLGESSYSLYLTHIFVLPVVALIWRKLGLGFDANEAVVFVGVSLLISAIVGWMSFVSFERPVTSFLRRAKLPQRRGLLLRASD